jgi:hypothetical protein
VLEFLHQTLPPLGAPIFLALTGLVALIVFSGAWMLMPGGKAELMGLVADLRSALQKKTVRATTLETIAVAG